MNMVIFIRLILIITVTVLLDFLLKLNKSLNIERRLARYSIDSNIENNDDNLGDILKNKYNRILKKMRRNLKNNKELNKQSLKYDKYVMVGDNVNLLDFIIIKLLIGFTFTALVIISYAIRGKLISFIGLVFTFILGYYIYDVYLHIYNKRRMNKIKNDMLRAVIVMNNAFKAGKSTIQAVEIVSKTLPKPISIEFKRIYQDLNFGISSDIAFSRFAKRVKIDEAKYISSSLTILNKTGGNIINVFSAIERSLYDKKRLETDLKNSTEASNLVVKFLMVIPIFFVAVIYILSPGYFAPFFTSPLGFILLFILLIMFIIYIYLLNKIMKVRV
ncbi:MAG: type II secretion system F family protein [Bacilli bacterium]|nr:type II secretion system F family protein [Bacilli bacterium]